MRWALLILARNWLRFALTIPAIYISLPWLAPTLATLGLRQPADFIYTLYSPFCHQFAFRSPFVFGEQGLLSARGRENGILAFRAICRQFGSLPRAVPSLVDALRRQPRSAAGRRRRLGSLQRGAAFAARHFIGDANMGYKTSLCARDLAIYSMIFVGGLIYRRYRWRIRPLPFWLYLIVGLGPVGLDGFSQLLSYPPFEFWPVRETTPLLRLVTGGLFGLMSAWLGFPYIERSMQDLVDQLGSGSADRP